MRLCESLRGLEPTLRMLLAIDVFEIQLICAAGVLYVIEIGLDRRWK
jgi:hypothetical protein